MRKRIIFPSCERSSDSKLNCQTLGKIIHKVQQFFLKMPQVSQPGGTSVYLPRARLSMQNPATHLVAGGKKTRPRKKDVNASITRDGEISIRKSLKSHAGHHQKNGTYSGNVAKFQQTMYTLEFLFQE